jgi:hypothetical protein
MDSSLGCDLENSKIRSGDGSGNAGEKKIENRVRS